MSILRTLMVAITVTLMILAVWIAGTENVIASLIAFPLWAIGGLLALLFANLFLVSFRFWRILAHYGINLPWNVASRASISGHLAALFVISLFGQVMGRQAVLRNFGVRPVVISGLAAYERVAMMLVSGVLCILGSFYLLGQSAVVGFVGHIPFTEILIACIGAVGLSLWLGRSHFESKLFEQCMSWRNVARISEIAGVTLITQLLMLSCYVLGALSFRHEIDIVHLLAAASIISFAASLPITVNGWGVREVVAVYVLGKLGIPAPEAVSVSVMVGVCSTLVILAAIPFSLGKNGGQPLNVSQATASHSEINIEKISAWLLGMAATVAVFFQVQISLPGGVVTINLADPFAILAFAAVSLHVLFDRKLPIWRVRHFNLALFAISLLLLEGFIHGWLVIGITQWALAGRLIGWLILLGYLSAGYLIVAHAGAHGLRRFVETITLTASAIVILQASLRIIDHWGISLGDLTARFEGYSGNPNAFAFQLLVTVAILLGYSKLYAKYRSDFLLLDKSILFIILLAILLVGLMWTNSRMGMIVGVMLLLAAWLGRFADRRILGYGVIIAAILWGGFGYKPQREFFLILGIATLLIGYSKFNDKYRINALLLNKSILLLLLPSIMLVGFILTKSVVGLIAGGMLLLGIGLGRAANRRIIGYGVLFAVILWVAGWLESQRDNSLSVYFINRIASIIDIGINNAIAYLNRPGSNQEHLKTLYLALNLWRESPLAGAGLGVALVSSPVSMGYAQVIHSTPLWILAEFGLLGVLVVGGAFFSIAHYAWINCKVLLVRHSLLLLLAVFCLFSLVHEIFYQRIFWLTLGALLALPSAHKGQHHTAQLA